MTEEKRICLNPHHPFKQKWYIYHADTNLYIDSPNYCTSCMSYLNMLKTVLSAIVMPRESLYGKQVIYTDPEQIYDIAKEIFKELPELTTDVQ